MVRVGYRLYGSPKAAAESAMAVLAADPAVCFYIAVTEFNRTQVRARRRGGTSFPGTFAVASASLRRELGVSDALQRTL